MVGYLGQRLLFGLLTVLAASIVAFVIVRALPADALDLIYGQYGTDPESIDRLRDDLGLNNPPVQQYFEWLSGVVRLDFGDSLVTQRPIRGSLLNALGVSVELGAIALLLALFIGVPVGIISAIKKDSLIDQVARGTAMIGLAVPLFWLAVLSLILPAIYLNWLPPTGYTSLWSNPAASIYGLLVPAGLVAVVFAGPIVRFVRSAMLDVLGQEYITTARAKGLAPWRVVWHHAFRNAMIPVVSLVGIQITYLLSGIVVIEEVYNIPGLGKYLLDALDRRDYPTVQAVVLVFAILVVIVNLVIDLLYTVLDPRVKIR